MLMFYNKIYYFPFPVLFVPVFTFLSVYFTRPDIQQRSRTLFHCNTVIMTIHICSILDYKYTNRVINHPEGDCK